MARKLRKIFDPESEDVPMRVVGFMSGKGSDLVNILEHERRLEAKGESPFKVGLIFSNNYRSNAPEIGNQFNVPVFTFDFKGFCEAANVPLRDIGAREDYDNYVSNVMSMHNIDFVVLAGYTSLLTYQLTDVYPIMNVHHGDLSITDEQGARKYTGKHAVTNALLAGETELRSTIHMVDRGENTGPILLVSPPIAVIEQDYGKMDGSELTQFAESYKRGLREPGDKILLPTILKSLAEGRFARDREHNVYFNGEAIPDGLRLTY